MKIEQGELWGGVTDAAERVGRLAHDGKALRGTFATISKHKKGYCKIVRIPSIQIRDEEIAEEVKRAINKCLESCAVAAIGKGARVFADVTRKAEEETSSHGAIDTNQ